MRCPNCGERRIDDKCHWVKFYGVNEEHCYRRVPCTWEDAWVTEENLLYFLTIYSPDPPAGAPELLDSSRKRKALIVFRAKQDYLQAMRRASPAGDRSVDRSRTSTKAIDVKVTEKFKNIFCDGFCRRWPHCGTYTPERAQTELQNEALQAIPRVDDKDPKWKEVLEAWRTRFDADGTHVDVKPYDRKKASREASSSSNMKNGWLEGN